MVDAYTVALAREVPDRCAIEIVQTSRTTTGTTEQVEPNKRNSSATPKSPPVVFTQLTYAELEQLSREIEVELIRNYRGEFSSQGGTTADEETSTTRCKVDKGRLSGRVVACLWPRGRCAAWYAIYVACSRLECALLFLDRSNPDWSRRALQTVRPDILVADSRDSVVRLLSERSGGLMANRGAPRPSGIAPTTNDQENYINHDSAGPYNLTVNTLALAGTTVLMVRKNDEDVSEGAARPHVAQPERIFGQAAASQIDVAADETETPGFILKRVRVGQILRELSGNLTSSSTSSPIRELQGRKIVSPSDSASAPAAHEELQSNHTIKLTKAVADEQQRRAEANARDGVVCLCATGGTTSGQSKLKVARCTRKMVQAELSCYPRLFEKCNFDVEMKQEGAACRVLQPSAFAWGAAVFGQIDLTLSLRGTLVVLDAEQLAHPHFLADHDIHVAGLTPSTWKRILIPDCLRVAISWGEACHEEVSRRQEKFGMQILQKKSPVDILENNARYPDPPLNTTQSTALSEGGLLQLPRPAPPPLIFLDLLLATEYWLSFYRTKLSEPFQCIADRTELEWRVSADETDTLAVSGSAVFAGYIDLDHDDIRPDVENSNFFDTGDRIRLAVSTEEDVQESTINKNHRAFFYVGRDVTDAGKNTNGVKVSGVWVNFEQAMQAVRDLTKDSCVFESKALCVVPLREKDILRIRQLTRGVPLIFLEEIPRHSITSKVALPTLRSMVSSQRGRVEEERKSFVTGTSAAWRQKSCTASKSHFFQAVALLLDLPRTDLLQEDLSFADHGGTSALAVQFIASTSHELHGILGVFDLLNERNSLADLWEKVQAGAAAEFSGNTTLLATTSGRGGQRPAEASSSAEEDHTEAKPPPSSRASRAGALFPPTAAQEAFLKLELTEASEQCVLLQTLARVNNCFATVSEWRDVILELVQQHDAFQVRPVWVRDRVVLWQNLLGHPADHAETGNAEICLVRQSASTPISHGNTATGKNCSASRSALHKVMEQDSKRKLFQAEDGSTCILWRFSLIVDAAALNNDDDRDDTSTQSPHDRSRGSREVASSSKRNEDDPIVTHILISASHAVCDQWGMTKLLEELAQGIMSRSSCCGQSNSNSESVSSTCTNNFQQFCVREASARSSKNSFASTRFWQMHFSGTTSPWRSHRKGSASGSCGSRLDNRTPLQSGRLEQSDCAAGWISRKAKALPTSGAFAAAEESTTGADARPGSGFYHPLIDSTELYHSRITTTVWTSFNRTDSGLLGCSCLNLKRPQTAYHLLCQLLVGPSRSLLHLYAMSSDIGMGLRAAPLWFPFSAETNLEKFSEDIDRGILHGMEYGCYSPAEIRAFAGLAAGEPLFSGVVVCHNAGAAATDPTGFSSLMSIKGSTTALQPIMESEVPSYDLAFEFSADQKFRIRAKDPGLAVALHQRLFCLLDGFGTSAALAGDENESQSIETIGDLLTRSAIWGKMFQSRPETGVGVLRLPSDGCDDVGDVNEGRSSLSPDARRVLDVVPTEIGETEDAAAATSRTEEQDEMLLSAFFQACAFSAGQQFDSASSLGIGVLYYPSGAETSCEGDGAPHGVDPRARRSASRLSTKQMSVICYAEPTSRLVPLLQQAQTSNKEHGRSCMSKDFLRLVHKNAQQANKLQVEFQCWHEAACGTSDVPSSWACVYVPSWVKESDVIYHPYGLDDDEPRRSRQFLSNNEQHDVDRGSCEDLSSCILPILGAQECILLFGETGRLSYSGKVYSRQRMEDLADCIRKLVLSLREVEGQQMLQDRTIQLDLSSSSKAGEDNSGSPSLLCDENQAGPQATVACESEARATNAERRTTIRTGNDEKNPNIVDASDSVTAADRIPEGLEVIHLVLQQALRTPHKTALFIRQGRMAVSYAELAWLLATKEKEAGGQEVLTAEGASASPHELRENYVSPIVPPKVPKKRRLLVQKFQRLCVLAQGGPGPAFKPSRALRKLKRRIEKENANLPCVGGGEHDDDGRRGEKDHYSARDIEIFCILRACFFFGYYIPIPSKKDTPEHRIRNVSWVKNYPFHEPGIVFHTSGTTGRPKPVMVTNRNVLSHLLYLQKKFPLQANDTVLACINWQWVASFPEIFNPLTSGASLFISDFANAPAVLVAPLEKNNSCTRPLAGGGAPSTSSSMPSPTASRKDKEPQADAHPIAAISACQFVPSVLNAMSDVLDLSKIPSLRRVILTGEPFPAKYLPLANSIQYVLNHYGQTEAADTTTLLQIPPGEEERKKIKRHGVVPLGQPTPYRRCQLQRDGGWLAPGELETQGPGLGYYIQDERRSDSEEHHEGEDGCSFRYALGGFDPYQANPEAWWKVFCEASNRPAENVGFNTSKDAIASPPSSPSSGEHRPGTAGATSHSIRLELASAQKALAQSTKGKTEIQQRLNNLQYRSACDWLWGLTLSVMGTLAGGMNDQPQGEGEQGCSKKSTTFPWIVPSEVLRELQGLPKDDSFAKPDAVIRFLHFFGQALPCFRVREHANYNTLRARECESESSATCLDTFSSGPNKPVAQRRPSRKKLPFEPSISGPGRNFRTGDVVRRAAVGTTTPDLLGAGRKDSQVKLQGMRVNLQEIEAVCREAAREAACLVTAEKKLVAFFEATDTDVVIGALREACVRKLPKALVPSKFVLVRQWPRLATGKIDKRRLLGMMMTEQPAASTSSAGEHVGVSVGSKHEEALADDQRREQSGSSRQNIVKRGRDHVLQQAAVLNSSSALLGGQHTSDLANQAYPAVEKYRETLTGFLLLASIWLCVGPIRFLMLPYVYYATSLARKYSLSNPWLFVLIHEVFLTRVARNGTLKLLEMLIVDEEEAPLDDEKGRAAIAASRTTTPIPEDTPPAWRKAAEVVFGSAEWIAKYLLVMFCALRWLDLNALLFVWFVAFSHDVLLPLVFYPVSERPNTEFAVVLYVVFRPLGFALMFFMGFSQVFKDDSYQLGYYFFEQHGRDLLWSEFAAPVGRSIWYWIRKGAADLLLNKLLATSLLLPRESRRSFVLTSAPSAFFSRLFSSSTERTTSDKISSQLRGIFDAVADISKTIFPPAAPQPPLWCRRTASVPQYEGKAYGTVRVEIDKVEKFVMRKTDTSRKPNF